MSERGESLRNAIFEADWDWNENSEECSQGEAIARAICEHLGVTWENVEVLKDVAMEEVDASFALDILPCAKALQTRLEAAGIPKDGE